MSAPAPRPRKLSRSRRAWLIATVIYGACRKTVVYVAGAAAQLVAAGMLHGEALRWTQLALLVLTGAGVYQARNVPTSLGPVVRSYVKGDHRV